MTKQVSGHKEAVRRLAELAGSVAHGRKELGARSDLVLNALLSNRDTVTRFTTGSRNRANVGGRTAARRHSTGMLIAVARPELQGWLSDGIPRSATRTPDWDSPSGPAVSDPGASNDVVIDSCTHADGQGWVVIPSEDLALDHVERGDVPKWSTEERICADWSRILRDALNADSSTVIEHGTTLATLAAIRMSRNSDIGHVEYSPPLGRDGRVSLPDIYDDVAVISIYIPEERLLCSVESVERIGEQRGEYNPHNDLFDHADVEPPSNGFLEAD